MSETKKSIDTFPSGWTLSHQEVSNGVYKVRLTANFGSIVEVTGTDLDELVGRCIKSAKDIETQRSLY